MTVGERHDRAVDSHRPMCQRRSRQSLPDIFVPMGGEWISKLGGRLRQTTGSGAASASRNSPAWANRRSGRKHAQAAHNLGDVLRAREDLAAAMVEYRFGLALREALVAESPLPEHQRELVPCKRNL